MRNKKYPHHDTIHLIGAILAPYIFKTMRDQEPFDQSRYVFLLKKYKSRKPEKIWDLIDEFTHNPDCRVFLSTDLSRYRLKSASRRLCGQFRDALESCPNQSAYRPGEPDRSKEPLCQCSESVLDN